MSTLRTPNLKPLRPDVPLPVLYVDQSVGLESLHDEAMTRLQCVYDLCNGITWSAGCDMEAKDVANLIGQTVHDALGLVHAHHEVATALEARAGGAA